MTYTEQQREQQARQAQQQQQATKQEQAPPPPLHETKPPVVVPEPPTVPRRGEMPLPKAPSRKEVIPPPPLHETRPPPPKLPPPTKPTEVPEVKIPSGAQITSLRADKSPEVYKHKGQAYYAPGSTMYKMGFRTWDEYRKAQQLGASHGTHPGALVPEGSIIVTWHGEQYRFTPADFEAGRATRVAQTALRKDKFKVPMIATDELGHTREVLLSAGDAKVLEGLSGMAQFNRAIKLGLIPYGSLYVPLKEGNWEWKLKEKAISPKLKEFVDEKGQLKLNEAIDAGFTKVEDYEGWQVTQGEINAIIVENKAWGRAFEKEIKDQPAFLQKAYSIGGVEGYNREVERYNEQLENDLKAIKDFEVEGSEGSYRIGEMINADIAPAIIKRAFGDEAYTKGVAEAAELQKYNAYQAANPEGKFNILMAEGVIPRGSKFDSEDKEGNIKYFPPVPEYPGAGLTADEISPLSAKFKAIPPRNQRTIIQLALHDVEQPTFSLEEQKKIKAEDPALWQALKFGTRRSNLDWLTEEEKERVLGYYSTLEPTKVLGIAIPAEKTPEFKAAVTAGKIILAPIPVVGTAVWWQDMNNYERSASIIIDGLIVTAILKPGLIMRILRSATQTKEMQAVNKITTQSVRTSVRALKRVDPKLVKPFKEMAKAQAIYAETLTNVRNLERTLARSAGEVVPEIRRNLAGLRDKVPGLRDRFMQTAEDFTNAQLKAARSAYNDVPLKTTGFAGDIVRDTEQAVELAFRQLKGVKTLETQISTAVKTLGSTKSDATRAVRVLEDLDKKWTAAGKPFTGALANALRQQKLILTAAGKRSSEIALKITRLQGELLVAKSGTAQKLGTQLAGVRNKITATAKEIKETEEKLLQLTMDLQKQPQLAETAAPILAQYRATIQSSKTSLKALILQQGRLQKELGIAFNGMEASWDLPLSKGRGNVITRVLPTVTPRYVGGGVAPQVSEKPFISAIGTKGTRAIIAGQEAVVSEPLVTEPELPDVVITDPHLVVAVPPRPAVKPEVEPEVEPKPKVWPIYPPIPEPYHKGIYFLEALRLAPAVRQKLETIVSPYLKTEIATQAIQTVRNLAAVGYKPATIAKILARLKASAKVSEVTDPASKAAMATKPYEATKVKEALKTTTAPVVVPITTPVVKPEPAIKPKPAVELKPLKPLEPLKPLKPLLPLPMATDKEKREHIRKAGGAVAWNMGKLGRKNPQDIWHVRMPDGKHIVLRGAPPQGARILADGPGSAYKTTQAIDGPLRRAIVQRHGAVTATITPARTPKGAQARFSPTGLTSIKKGRQYFTKMGSGVAISRKPLGRRHKR